MRNAIVLSMKSRTLVNHILPIILPVFGSKNNAMSFYIVCMLSGPILQGCKVIFIFRDNYVKYLFFFLSMPLLLVWTSVSLLIY